MHANGQIDGKKILILKNVEKNATEGHNFASFEP